MLPFSDFELLTPETPKHRTGLTRKIPPWTPALIDILKSSCSTSSTTPIGETASKRRDDLALKTPPWTLVEVDTSKTTLPNFLSSPVLESVLPTLKHTTLTECVGIITYYSLTNTYPQHHNTHIENVSHELTEFLEKTLEANRVKRISIDDIQQLAWLSC
ncbi:unnamed protein product [Didymodactylos carnosus]|uniref:Uncharacterized protein n=1 Tax=Didymodactylos carnosus TaxID=1234261 RepID=A0A814V6T0_9BILA|nr:unnamed protein product [Didymodactylos carnosus]CAF3950455.1 unnamed protein product [Didymodactylos carnosus]